jgi:hypothetical protein
VSEAVHLAIWLSLIGYRDFAIWLSNRLLIGLSGYRAIGLLGYWAIGRSGYWADRANGLLG